MDVSIAPEPVRLSDAPADERGRAGVPGPARLAVGVLLLTLAMYVLTASGHLHAQDEEYYLQMARGLVLNHSFAVQPFLAGDHELSGARGVDGRFYPQYAPGFPLVLAPVVLLGRELAGPLAPLRATQAWGSQSDADFGSRLLLSYFNAPVTAATAAVLALLVLRLGYPPAAAAFTALAYGLATMAWPQARGIYPEPLQGLLLLLSFLALLRPASSRALWGGAALGLAILVKLTSLLALPALLLLPAARGRPLWRSPGLPFVLAGPIAALALHGVYNAARFGNPLTTAYQTGTGEALSFAGNPLIGLFGLLLPPGRGIIWYAPPVIAAILVCRRFRRTLPDTAIATCLAVLSGLWLVVHAFWVDWDAGWGWGPRYLLPILPLLLLPLATAWQRKRTRLAALALAALGALIQIPGAIVDFAAWGHEASVLYLKTCTECTNTAFRDWRYLYNPAASDIVGHTGLMLSGNLDLAVLSLRETWLRPATLGLAGLLAALGAWLLSKSLATGSTDQSVASDRPRASRRAPRFTRAAALSFGAALVCAVLLAGARGFDASRPSRIQPASAGSGLIRSGPDVTPSGLALLVTNTRDRVLTITVTMTFRSGGNESQQAIGTIHDLPPGQTRAILLAMTSPIKAGEVAFTLDTSLTEEAGGAARAETAARLTFGNPSFVPFIGLGADVTNSDAAAHSFLDQAALLRDGKPVGITSTTVENLGPGERRRVGFELRGDLPDYDEILVYVDRLLS